MKKVKYLLFGLLVLPMTVNAAGSATISGPASIDNGGSATVSVTVKNTAAWNISISGAGNTPGCSTKVADVTADGNNTTKTFNLTCKSNAVGSITFTATGDITSSDGAKSYVNLTKTVTVNKPREKESESRLNSLSIDGYKIDFSKDKKEYSIVVEPTVSSIKINASAISKYASVSGTGSKELDSEENKFVVICTSETGSKTEYTINVSVKDDNPVKAKIGEKEYTVFKSNKLLTAPTNYEETTIKIGDFDIPAYKNDITKLTIVGLKDSDGNINYAIYDNNKYTIYNENKSDGLLLYISEKDLDNYKKITIKIGEKEYTGYEIDERFSIVYAMNISNGEYSYYKYDNKENTFQVIEIENDIKSANKFNIFIITTIVFGISSVGMIGYEIFKIINKNKKTSKKKD